MIQQSNKSTQWLLILSSSSFTINFFLFEMLHHKQNLTADKESIKKLLNKLIDRAWICLSMPLLQREKWLETCSGSNRTHSFMSTTGESLMNIDDSLVRDIDLRHWKCLSFTFSLFTSYLTHLQQQQHVSGANANMIEEPSFIMLSPSWKHSLLIIIIYNIFLYIPHFSSRDMGQTVKMRQR